MSSASRVVVGLVGFAGAGKNTAARGLTSSSSSSTTRNEKDTNTFVAEAHAACLKDGVSVICGLDRAMLEGDGSVEERMAREIPDPFWFDQLTKRFFSSGHNPQEGPVPSNYASGRWFLRKIGLLFRKEFYPDFWLDCLWKRLMKTPEQSVVITDCRYANEMQRIKAVGGRLIRIRRDDDSELEWLPKARAIAQSSTFVSEKFIQDYDRETVASLPDVSEWAWLQAESSIDTIIENNGTIDKLQTELRTIFLF